MSQQPQYKVGDIVRVTCKDSLFGWKHEIKIGKFYRVTGNTRKVRVVSGRVPENDPHKYYTRIYINETNACWALPNCCFQPVGTDAGNQLLFPFMYE